MAEKRRKVFSALVTLAENDPRFRKEVINNLEDTIRDWGFVLTAEEMYDVQAAHRSWADKSDAQILRELADLREGLAGFPEGPRRR
jgi:hypothetical protein